MFIPFNNDFEYVVLKGRGGIPELQCQSNSTSVVHVTVNESFIP